MTGLVPVRASAAVRIGTLVVGMVLAAGLLAGCGGSSSASPGVAQRSAPSSLGRVTTGADGVQQVTLQTEDDYVFTPDHFTVAPGKVRLTVENVAKQLTHDFTFSADGGPEASPRRSRSWLPASSGPSSSRCRRRAPTASSAASTCSSVRWAR